MVLLPRPLEQCLIGCFSDEVVLKDIGGMRWEPLLVQKFRFHSLAQFTLYDLFLKPGNGLEELKRKLSPEHGAQLYHASGGAKPIHTRHQGIMQGGGNR